MVASGDSRVNRKWNLGHVALSDRRICLATRIIDFRNIYSRFDHILLSATRIEAAISMLFDLLIARAVYTLHAIIEDIIEILHCLLFHAFVFTEISLRYMFFRIDHMVKLATIPYFYLNPSYIQTTFILSGVHKGIFVIDIHEIHMNVFIDPVFKFLLVAWLKLFF